MQNNVIINSSTCFSLSKNNNDYRWYECGLHFNKYIGHGGLIKKTKNEMQYRKLEMQHRDIAMYQDDCGQGHLYLIGATILRWHMRHFIRAYETVIYS